MTRPVLIIEDDPDIAEGLRYNLEREGLEARVAETGEQGLQAALDKKNPPALILLDLMLPGMSGTELCRRLRREPQTRRTPIIMLTARGAESERVAGLELGADDYISKPFSVRELMARVRAVLRRADETASAVYEDEKLQIYFEDMRVVCDGAEVKLTRKEFALLAALARRPAGWRRDSSYSTTFGASSTTATRARSTFTYAASGRSSARAPTQSRPWSASATASPAAPA